MEPNRCKNSLDKTMGSKLTCVELEARKVVILPENRDCEGCDPQVESSDDPRRF